MSVRILFLGAGLLAAAPAFAQAADQKAAQNAANWEIFQKLYPSRALAAKEEGAVGFRVTIDGTGAVTQCQVTHSSGHPLLDEETCNLITLHAEFKPETEGSRSQVRTREGVIAWKLPGSSTQLAAPRQLAAGSAPEKKVCKKTVRTGTLSGFERTCMTPTEWNRQADEMKEPWEDLQGKKGSTHGG